MFWPLIVVSGCVFLIFFLFPRFLTQCVLIPPELPPESMVHVFYRWDRERKKVVYVAKFGIDDPDQNQWWRLTTKGFFWLSEAKALAAERNETHGGCVNGLTYAVSWPTPRTDFFR